METIWTEEIDSILKIGIFLGDIGISNWALTKEQALFALEQFNSKGIGVLGGDVYDNQDGYFKSNYDNWYYDKKNEEIKAKFVANSIDKSKFYIANYRKKESFFVLVPNC